MHMVTGLYQMSVQAVENIRVRKEAQAVPVHKQHAIKGTVEDSEGSTNSRYRRHMNVIDEHRAQTASLPVCLKSMLAGSQNPSGSGGEEENPCSCRDCRFILPECQTLLTGQLCC